MEVTNRTEFLGKISFFIVKIYFDISGPLRWIRTEFLGESSRVMCHTERELESRHEIVTECHDIFSCS